MLRTPKTWVASNEETKNNVNRLDPKWIIESIQGERANPVMTQQFEAGRRLGSLDLGFGFSKE